MIIIIVNVILLLLNILMLFCYCWYNFKIYYNYAKLVIGLWSVCGLILELTQVAYLSKVKYEDSLSNVHGYCFIVFFVDFEEVFFIGILWTILGNILYS